MYLGNFDRGYADFLHLKRALFISNEYSFFAFHFT